MRRRYKNKKIYRNFKIAYVLTIIHLVLIIIGTPIKIANFIIGTEKWSIMCGVICCLFYFISLTSFLRKEVMLAERNEIETSAWGKETKTNNDFTMILLWVGGLFVLSFAFVDTEDVIVELSKAVLGYLTGCVLSLTPSSFLIRNLILIKREWKKNPPEFLKQEEENRNKEKTQRELDKKIDQSSNLFAKCGIKFFVKYYYQIRDLPLKDIEIEESYGAIERWERLSAARKIIDLNLTEIGLRRVLKDYKDIFPIEELQKIKAILGISENIPVKTTNTKVVRADDSKQSVVNSEESRIAQCSDLIADCGIKFFIKYYYQIKNLPLKDVEIEEDYPQNEKTERLLAAKKVIDFNLTNIAAREILKDYNSVLSAEEKQMLKTIMTNSNQNNINDEESRIAQCSDLIADCGIKFFLKYYHQIKNLPLKDVEIEENYSQNEKTERLLAAKNVIDLNLSNIAAREILKDYKDVLSTKEKQIIESILEAENKIRIIEHISSCVKSYATVDCFGFREAIENTQIKYKAKGKITVNINKVVGRNLYFDNVNIELVIYLNDNYGAWRFMDAEAEGWSVRGQQLRKIVQLSSNGSGTYVAEIDLGYIAESTVSILNELRSPRVLTGIKKISGTITEKD